MMFQSLAALKIFPDSIKAMQIIVAIAFNDIGHSFIQGNNTVMADPFVGVIDDFLGKKDSLGVTVG